MIPRAVVVALPAGRVLDFINSMRLVSDVCDAAATLGVPSPMATGFPADFRVGEEWRFILGCGVRTTVDGMDIAPFEIRVFRGGVLFGRSAPDGGVFQFPADREPMWLALRLAICNPEVQA